MELYVTNIAYECDGDDLRNLFTPYGDVISSRVIMDNETGRSRGFGFVKMANRDDAEAAINDLNGAEMHGRTLQIREAEQRANTGGYPAGGRGFPARGRNAGGW